MLEATGNLWSYPAQVIVITTNGNVKASGAAVMGRGVARQALNEFEGIDMKLGTYLSRYGNRPFNLGVWNSQSHERDFIIATLPTKWNWKDKSHITLIEDSCRALVAMADKFGWQSVVMPPPGCGLGGLDWAYVKAHIEDLLDDRFTVLTSKG
jgi:O-acetyl-ADP-ribose deacetylase (regulator of RNase III)